MQPENWLLLATAALGATGAVAAQSIAAAFTARRETKRLNWERERFRMEGERVRVEQFAQEKRELYSRFLRLTYPNIAAAVRYTASEKAPEGTFRRARLFPEVEDELEQVRFEIHLVGSPQVVQAVEAVVMLWVIVQIHIGAQEEWPLEHRHEAAKDALSRWQEAQRVMRADLAGDAPPRPRAADATGATAERLDATLDRLQEKYG